MSISDLFVIDSGSLLHDSIVMGTYAAGAMVGTLVSTRLGPPDSLIRSIALLLGAVLTTILQATALAAWMSNQSEPDAYTIPSLAIIGLCTPIAIDLEHDRSRWWETLIFSVLLWPVYLFLYGLILFARFFFFPQVPVLALVPITIVLARRTIRIQRRDRSSNAFESEPDPMMEELVTLEDKNVSTDSAPKPVVADAV